MVLCKKFATKCCVYLPKIANCLNCRKRYIQVSISQSRYFSFQPHKSSDSNPPMPVISISQSRYFSFQPVDAEQRFTTALQFQSRNRDTFLFNTLFCRHNPINAFVSISQSRYFSFQRLSTGTLMIRAAEVAISVSGVFWLGKRSDK